MTEISVVIPTKNRATYILEALESVFAQTFKDYEVIVVDDGSTDETVSVLKPLVEAKKIRYVFQPSAGVSAARNHGVRLAAAPYIAFLDSDDLFLPSKLEKQIALFRQNPEHGFVHCSFSKFDDGGRDLGVRDTSQFSGWIYPTMLQEWSVLMAMPCMLMRADALREAGGFDEQMSWAEDLDLWRRIARRYPVGVVPEPLVRVRVHAASTTFARGGGTQGFERYLEKAFAEDDSLPVLFKRKARAKMYAKLAQNLLGEGGPREMRQVRQNSFRALAAWPLQISALFAYIASWIPGSVRHWLAERLRQTRYPVDQSASL